MAGKIQTQIQKTLWQIPALLVLAGGIAISVNYWRNDGIPLVRDWSAEARFSDAAGNSLVIDLDQARQLFENQEALFLDARPESLYREGHIRGAFNIPFQDVDRYFAEVMEKLDRTKVLITYCDGESCELSHNLALFLLQMGFENVRVLVNGWTVWKTAGLPVDARG